MAALLLGVVLMGSAQADVGPWIRPGGDSDLPRWGLRDGVVVSLWPAGVSGDTPGGPRGLLRIGYPVGPGGQHQLVNFIAVEPNVGDGQWRGQSELETSDTDGQPGRVFSAETLAGTLGRPPDAPEAERLQVVIRMERFRNGAHPYLVLTLRSDQPDEIMLQTFHEPDSRPMTMCVLTATMGNYARLRQVHLAGGEVLSSLVVWPDHTGHDFTPFTDLPLSRLVRTGDGGVIVPMSNNEADPAANWPHDPGNWWRWPWAKLTQYWRKTPGSFGQDLRFAANGRAEYYGWEPLVIPGGVAFENTELREAYAPGQAVIFGLTRETPAAVLKRWQ
ncbi:MAG: hypothetical protein HPY69_08850 [Armatimonadetes bacterium]|nr:hypothetical protein [Armatimonadota bacterium]